MVRGKGSHAAQPQQGVDPLMVAVQLAQSWQSVISRSKNPIDTAVLSITRFHAGETDNVIPDEAVMRGTVRTFSTEVLDMIEARMRGIASHTVAAFGATMEFQFDRNFPPRVNSEAETALAV
jgi:hippurate hydrolase